MQHFHSIILQDDNSQPCRTPFPILNQSFVPCKVLTVASCNMRQVTQEAGKVVWYFHLLKNFPQFFVIHAVKGFAAAAAKLLQSCPTLYDPIDGSPPGSPVPGILQARTLERVAVSFSNA